MGMFPRGCEIVPNPYNRIPGFFVRDHTFVPGFPVMAWPMLEWTLDTRYRALHHQVRHAEHSFLVFDMPESRITPAMVEIEQRWPGVRLQPAQRGRDGRAIAYRPGRQGEPEAAAQALAFLRAEVVRLGGKLAPPAQN